MTRSITELHITAEADLKERIERDTARLALFSGNNAGILDEAFEAINEEVSIDPYIDSDLDVYLSFTGNGEDYTHVYKILRRAGYEPTHQMGEGDKAYFSTTWRKENAPGIWVSFSSNACRREIVGTKMVEENIYELICDD
jgi:hypothetical protein